jgi:hypothetical protein
VPIALREVKKESFMTDEHLQGLQLRLSAMKNLVAELDTTIIDRDAKDYLLGLTKNWLGDVERFLKEKKQWQIEAAGFMLTLTERQLVKAQQLVSKYGANLRVIGG